MTLLGDLLEYTLTHRYILVIPSLSYGAAYLLFLIVYRSRYKSSLQKMVWVMQIELAIYLIVMGILHWLNMYGVDTTIAFGLTSWLFTFAVLATITVFLLVNKSRSSMYVYKDPR